MELTFAVSTFAKVFDTTPAGEVLSLAELTAALTRFELKPKLPAEVDRELNRLERAWTMWQSGDGAGTRWSELVRAQKAAEKAGEAVEPAVRARYEALQSEARKGVKRLLRSWAPALYAPGTTRGKEGVVQLSSLVLDYDDGTRIADASARWESFFHIVHTTWSHTPEHHKLRLILPLAQPVKAGDWAAVYAWAEQRTGQVVDPSMKGVAAAFALPAVGSRTHPRDAFVHEGTILDPVAFGVVDEGAPPVPRTPEARGVLRDGDPDHVYLASVSSLGAEALEDPALWDQFSEVLIAPTVHEDAASPAPPVDDVRWAELEARVAALEGERMIDALERLTVLRATGELSEEEFVAAKRKVLR